MPRRRIRRIAGLVGAVAALAPASALAAPTVTVAALGDVLAPLSLNSLGSASPELRVNSAGQVLLHEGTRRTATAHLWQDGVRTKLATPDGNVSFGQSLDEAGNVLGWTAPVLPLPTGPFMTSFKLHLADAVTWDATGTRTATFPGSAAYPRSFGWFLNEAGAAAIQRFRGTDGSGEMAVAAGGRTSVLPEPAGLPPLSARDLVGFNRGGAALVQADIGPEYAYHLATGSGQLAPIPSTLYVQPRGTRGRLLNDLYQVLVRSKEEPRKSAVWSPFGQITLDLLPGVPAAGHYFTRGLELNNHGDVTGYTCFGACVYTGALHAAVWHGGRPTDINPFGAHDSTGLFINDRGTAVGAYTRSDGATATFAWRDGTAVDLGAGRPMALSPHDDRVVIIDTAETSIVAARLATIRW